MLVLVPVPLASGLPELELELAPSLVPGCNPPENVEDALPSRAHAGANIETAARVGRPRRMTARAYPRPCPAATREVPEKAKLGPVSCMYKVSADAVWAELLKTTGRSCPPAPSLIHAGMLEHGEPWFV